MENKNRHSTSQLLDFAQDSYLERTSRPIYAIVFLLPLIVFYELGVILIQTDVLQQSSVLVDAFVWLQKLCEYLGFGSKMAWVAPPLVVVVVLAALQLTSRKQWRFRLGDIFPMAAECVVLAVPLIVFGLILNRPAAPQIDPERPESRRVQVYCQTEARLSLARAAAPADDQSGNPANRQQLLADIVTGIGAGIYEELIF